MQTASDYDPDWEGAFAMDYTPHPFDDDAPHEPMGRALRSDDLRALLAATFARVARPLGEAPRSAMELAAWRDEIEDAGDVAYVRYGVVYRMSPEDAERLNAIHAAVRVAAESERRAGAREGVAA